MFTWGPVMPHTSYLLSLLSSCDSVIDIFFPHHPFVLWTHVLEGDHFVELILNLV